MQVLIGDLTTEQFARLIGVALGTVISVVGLWLLFIALLRGILDGWLYRKGVLYYGSFKFLNVKFRALKSCDTVENLLSIKKEITIAVKIFQYQRILPKILCVRILNRLDNLYVLRLNEFCGMD